jgi:hypothetical protein
MSSSNGALLSKDIVDLQDIEKVQFLQTLQADPAQYASYVSERANQILGEVTDSKRAAFLKASADMARMIDMDHNSLAALRRSEDLTGMQDHIIDEQSKLYGSATNNRDLTRRQVEINNWYYESKRETLFVLQLLLLVMLAAVVVLAGQSYGWVNEEAANWTLIVLFLIGGGTWTYRWYYTTYVRDPRYWSRRSFAADKGGQPSSGAICLNY